MTIDEFLADFDLYADCPNAVAKLRELILELAVRGMLVEHQDGWLDDDGKRFSIPKKWKWSSLTDLGELSGGMTPSKAVSGFWGGGVPWFSSKDIKADELFSSELTISEKGLVETRLKLYPAGCLFVVVRSGILKRTLPVAINRIAATVNQDLKVFQSKTELDIRFIQLALKGLERIILTEYVKTGTTVQSLKFDEFESMPIPLPPLEEQKRIVAKADELMALCDALEAQHQAREQSRLSLSRAALAAFAEAPTPANLELLFHPDYAIDPADLRKTILTLAVQGKLVEQDGKRASMPLGEILAEASFNGVSKSPVDDSSATEVLKISAGTSRKDFTVDEGDYKFVALSDDEIEKSHILPGDLLACRYNGNLHYVGRFSIYKGLSGRVQVNPDKLIRFRVDAKLHDPMYVCYAMNSAVIRNVIESMCSTTAGNIGLSAGKMKTIEIPLPPLAEQKRIVVKVEELMRLVDRLEAELAHSRETATRLMEAMVAELLGKAA